MEAFIIQNLAPIMFASLIVALLLGYPAAFSLAFVGLFYALVGIGLGQFQPDFLQALPDRIYGVMSNDTLLAIPFFTFMGLVLERSGMAEDLLDTIGQVFGTVRGGLAYAVIFVGALLAATTGVVAASVISMGLISLPIMLRYGYDRRFASGVIAASGTLAQIIPPSLVLIVMADQLGKSVGDMYEGAFIPGLALAGMYAVWTLFTSIAFPKATPGLPAEAIGFREPDGSRGLWSLLVLTIASAVFGWYMMRDSGTHGADFVVLSMFFGILFAFGVAVVNWGLERLTGLRFLSHMAQQTTFVMVPPLFLIFLVLGTIFIGVATPTEGGAMGASGALILGVNMQTSVLHPPFGFALFYLRSVAPRDSFLDRVTGKLTPGVTTGQIYWGAVPFVLIQLVAVISVIMFPATVMHYKAGLSTVDPNKVQINIPQIDLPPLDLGPPEIK